MKVPMVLALVLSTVAAGTAHAGTSQVTLLGTRIGTTGTGDGDRGAAAQLAAAPATGPHLGVVSDGRSIPAAACANTAGAGSIRWMSDQELLAVWF
jgi:hypothetical protein